MKIIEKDIFDFQENDFFYPIRNKSDYIRTIILGARQLLLDFGSNSSSNKAKMKLIVDKMSRLFFYKGTKYFSISFPFTVLLCDENIIELTTYSGKTLNNKSISAIISIINSPGFAQNPSLIDLYIEPNGIESSGIFLLEEMFMFEPSYIRYDLDPVNHNGKLHPLDHLDINYSQCSTFKLGLNETITESYFENLQNIKTDCSFVTG